MLIIIFQVSSVKNLLMLPKHTHSQIQALFTFSGMTSTISSVIFFPLKTSGLLVSPMNYDSIIFSLASGIRFSKATGPVIRFFLGKPTTVLSNTLGLPCFLILDGNFIVDRSSSLAFSLLTAQSHHYPL